MGNSEMEFKVGDNVRIVADYPDPILQGETGNIVELPNEQHTNEYVVQLDGGIARKVYLEGQKIPVSADWLKLED